MVNATLATQPHSIINDHNVDYLAACKLCKNNVSNDSNIITCFACKAIYHATCLPGILDLVHNNQNVVYICNQCREFNFYNLIKRVEILENKLNTYTTHQYRNQCANNNFQPNNSHSVESNSNNNNDNNTQIKQTYADLFKDRSTETPNINEIANQLTKELIEREKKSHNLIIFNVNRETSLANDQNYMVKDRELVTKIAATMKISLDNMELNVKRLRTKPNPGGQTNSPLILEFKDKSNRQLFLNSAKNLKGSLFQNISIRHDLTKEQLAAEKQVRATFKTLKAEGQQVYMRHGVIYNSARGKNSNTNSQ